MARFGEAMLFILSLNVASMILGGAGVNTTIGLVGTNMVINIATVITGVFAGIVAYYMGNNVFSFVFIAWAALSCFIPTIQMVVLGFPQMLVDLGTPTWLGAPLYILWGMMFFFFALHLMTGRDTGD